MGSGHVDAGVEPGRSVVPMEDGGNQRQLTRRRPRESTPTTTDVPTTRSSLAGAAPSVPGASPQTAPATIAAPLRDAPASITSAVSRSDAAAPSGAGVTPP